MTEYERVPSFIRNVCNEIKAKTSAREILINLLANLRTTGYSTDRGLLSYVRQVIRESEEDLASLSELLQIENVGIEAFDILKKSHQRVQIFLQLLRTLSAEISPPHI